MPGLSIVRLDAGDDEAFLREARAVSNPRELVVWAAGERDVMRSLRSWFRREIGLSKDDVAIYGYWNRGTDSTEIDRHRLAKDQQVVGGVCVDSFLGLPGSSAHRPFMLS